MKRLIVTVLLITALASCKKNDLTQNELVGTWTEIQPCMRGTGYCYTLQFATNNKVYELSPLSDTGSYMLMDNNTIRIDSSIVWPGWQLSGSLVFQLTYSGDEIIIKNFWTPIATSGLIMPTPADLHLKKN